MLSVKNRSTSCLHSSSSCLAWPLWRLHWTCSFFASSRWTRKTRGGTRRRPCRFVSSFFPRGNNLKIHLQALAGAVRLEGDVITANGSILSGQMGHHCTETTSLDADDTSVCSCHCGCFTSNSRHRFGNVFGRVRTPVSIKVLVWPRPIAEVDTFLRDQSLLALKQSNFKRNPRAPPTDRTICALSHFVDLGVCRFTVRRSPTQIRHLLPVLPMHELHLPQGPVLPPPAIYPNHRASI